MGERRNRIVHELIIIEAGWWVQEINCTIFSILVPVRNF